MNVTTIGLDIAKNVFHLVGTDGRGEPVVRKQLKRAKVLEYFANLSPCLIGIEACGGSQYWARELTALGHEARLINPRYVKAFLRGNKNDYNDAGALCEAVAQPQMRFVPVKSVAQQDLQALHRVRDGWVGERTRWVNRARGLLAERGIVIAAGLGAFRRRVPELLEAPENGLSGVFRQLLSELLEQVRELDAQIAGYEERLIQASAGEEACQRLDEVPGIGPLVATRLVATVGDARGFDNARALAAGLGLVPRQHSSGGKPRLLGISKRGDKRLRAALIHGARAVVRHAGNKSDPFSRGIQRLQARRGTNVTTVAVANKLARIAWVLLSQEQRYRPARSAAL